MVFFLIVLLVSPIFASAEDLARRYESPLRWIRRHGLLKTAQWMTHADVVSVYRLWRKPFREAVKDFSAQDWAHLCHLSRFGKPVMPHGADESLKRAYYPFVEMINYGDVAVRDTLPADDHLGTYPWFVRQLDSVDRERLASVQEILHTRLRIGEPTPARAKKRPRDEDGD